MARLGTINYLAGSVDSSLYRNGQLLTRRNPDGSDTGFEGVVLEATSVEIEDARRLKGSKRRGLDKNGFELLAEPPRSSGLNFLSHQEVVREYYADCARVVQKTTGARHVFAFDHNVRSAAGKESQQRIRDGQEVQGPAHLAHGDYTLRSGPERLQQLAELPTGNDTFRPLLEPGQGLLDPEWVEEALGSAGRFALINLWRNIAEEPVATHPLALCDAQTVTPDDLVVFEIHYQDRIGENYFSKYSPRHCWFYYPSMTRDEALLIKQWDSAGGLAGSRGQQDDGADPERPCTFSFHSAFEDPSTPPDAPERWSIEVRCVACY